MYPSAASGYGEEEDMSGHGRIDYDSDYYNSEDINSLLSEFHGQAGGGHHHHVLVQRQSLGHREGPSHGHPSVQGSLALLPAPPSSSRATLSNDHDNGYDHPSQIIPPVLPHFSRRGPMTPFPYASQPTLSHGNHQGNMLILAVGDYHDDLGNVHLPPVTVPSHHPPPVSQPISTYLHSVTTAPISAPPLTLSDHRGNWPPSVPSNPYPGATAPMSAPPLTLSDYRGNWPPSVPSNPYPGAMVQMHPLNDYDGSLPLPIMVPSQDPRQGDLALLPAIADYRRNFPPPLVSMDGVSTLPPAAPDDIQPLAMPMPTPRSQTSERTSRKRAGRWRFVECSGQRQKTFEAPPSAPSTVPSDPVPTESAQPRIELPPLDYQANLPTHDAFILDAQKLIINDAVNNCAMIKPSAREDVIQAALADAVLHHLLKAHNIRSDSAESVKKMVQDFSQHWAAKNMRSLYMNLSAPFKSIMAASKEIVFIVIDRGYDLRPSLWSDTSESKSKQTKINDLINDKTQPLKFIFKKDENTGQWMAFEHDAILDVVIGVVRKLKYQLNVNDLDNLYCTAVAAIYCVLLQFSSGNLREMEFTSEAFKFMYDLAKKHITDVIEKDKDLAQRWSDVKAYTIVRLADVAAASK